MLHLMKIKIAIVLRRVLKVVADDCDDEQVRKLSSGRNGGPRKPETHFRRTL
jgi:hypothetical protein